MCVCLLCVLCCVFVFCERGVCFVGCVFWLNYVCLICVWMFCVVDVCVSVFLCLVYLCCVCPYVRVCVFRVKIFVCVCSGV